MRLVLKSKGKRKRYSAGTAGGLGGRFAPENLSLNTQFAPQRSFKNGNTSTYSRNLEMATMTDGIVMVSYAQRIE